MELLLIAIAAIIVVFAIIKAVVSLIVKFVSFAILVALVWFFVIPFAQTQGWI